MVTPYNSRYKFDNFSDPNTIANGAVDTTYFTDSSGATYYVILHGGSITMIPLGDPIDFANFGTATKYIRTIGSGNYGIDSIVEPSHIYLIFSASSSNSVISIRLANPIVPADFATATTATRTGYSTPRGVRIFKDSGGVYLFVENQGTTAILVSKIDSSGSVDFVNFSTITLNSKSVFPGGVNYLDIATSTAETYVFHVGRDSGGRFVSYPGGKPFNIAAFQASAGYVVSYAAGINCTAYSTGSNAYGFVVSSSGGSILCIDAVASANKVLPVASTDCADIAIAGDSNGLYLVFSDEANDRIGYTRIGANSTTFDFANFDLAEVEYYSPDSFEPEQVDFFLSDSGAYLLMASDTDDKAMLNALSDPNYDIALNSIVNYGSGVTFSGSSATVTSQIAYFNFDVEISPSNTAPGIDFDFSYTRSSATAGTVNTGSVLLFTESASDITGSEAITIASGATLRLGKKAGPYSANFVTESGAVIEVFPDSDRSGESLDLKDQIIGSGTTINVISGTATVEIASTSGITAGSGVTLIAPSNQIVISGIPEVTGAILAVVNLSTEYVSYPILSGGGTTIELDAGTNYLFAADAPGYLRQAVTLPGNTPTFTFALENFRALYESGTNRSDDIAFSYSTYAVTISDGTANLSFADVFRTLEDYLATESGVLFPYPPFPVVVDVGGGNGRNYLFFPYDTDLDQVNPVRIMPDPTNTSDPTLTDFVIVLVGATGPLFDIFDFAEAGGRTIRFQTEAVSALVNVTSGGGGGGLGSENIERLERIEQQLIADEYKGRNRYQRKLPGTETVILDKDVTFDPEEGFTLIQHQEPPP